MFERIKSFGLKLSGAIAGASLPVIASAQSSQLATAATTALETAKTDATDVGVALMVVGVTVAIVFLLLSMVKRH